MSLSLEVVPPLSEVLQPFSAVIATGGSSGIGKSFIQLVGKLKPSLTVCNLSRSAPQENIYVSLGSNLIHIPCDLAEPKGTRTAAAQVSGLLANSIPPGQVLLLNNSGVGAFGRFPEPDLDRELRMIDLNVRALVELTGLLLPALRDRGGAIMNIASTVAFQPTALCATYGATKAFVLNWTVALNEELRGSRVRALAICPGTTQTDFFRRAGVGAGSIGSVMSSEEVAMIALRALGRRHVITVAGWRNQLLTWAGAHVPKPFAARIVGKLLSRSRLASGAIRTTTKGPS